MNKGKHTKCATGVKNPKWQQQFHASENETLPTRPYKIRLLGFSQLENMTDKGAVDIALKTIRKAETEGNFLEKRRAKM